MPTEKIRPVLIIEQITARLKEDIVLGLIPPGSPLRETELQNRFGVSRSPIREALRELERQGFVIIQMRKGAFVRELTLRDIKNIYDVRAVLEGLAARELHRLDPDAGQKLSARLQEMDEAFGSGNREAYLKAHDNFHHTWINGCGNAFLTEETQRLRELSTWFAVYSHFDHLAFKNAIAAHRQIVDAFCSEKNSEQDIELCVRNNILEGGERIRQKVCELRGVSE